MRKFSGPTKSRALCPQGVLSRGRENWETACICQDGRSLAKAPAQKTTQKRQGSREQAGAQLGYKVHTSLDQPYIDHPRQDLGRRQAWQGRINEQKPLPRKATRTTNASATSTSEQLGLRAQNDKKNRHKTSPLETSQPKVQTQPRDAYEE